jgi:hypothetical protein
MMLSWIRSLCRITPANRAARRKQPALHRGFRPVLEKLEDRWAPSVTPMISGAASVEQEATYTLHLAEVGDPASAIQNWTINWGDTSAPQIVIGNPNTVTHVFATGNQTFNINATATDATGSYPSLQSVSVNVVAPVVLNFTSGTAVHLQGGDPDEYTSYTQNGFTVTPDVAIDGAGAHFHLANDALYTHVHDDELGGAGVVVLQSQNGAAFMLDSLVVPQLDNTAGGGSLTFSDSNGDSMTVTAVGTYHLNWGPITSFTITPNNLLDSLNQRGYVDSINVAPVTPPPHLSPVVASDTASPFAISGAASVIQEANYTLNLANPGLLSNRIQSWTINWGDGSAPQTVTGDPKSVTHVYTTGSQTFDITATANATATVTSSITNHPVTYVNSYLALQKIAVQVVTPVVKPTISGAAAVEQEAPYILHLAETGAPSYTIQSWTINWGDGSAPQTVTGDPSSVTHVYTAGAQTFTISATATYASNSYAALDNVAINVLAPVVINFTSGTAVHLQGGDPDEYTSYTQNGFTVTPDVAIDGAGAHFHLANDALYTHVHDDEPGGPGVVDLQMQSGAAFMLDSLVVPQLDNTAGGGSLTFSDSNGDSMTVTAAGTYQLNWGPITSFTITPNNLLDSLDQRGYVDSINVAPVSPPLHLSPAVASDTASPVTISGVASATQEATYTLRLANPGIAASAIQSWTINWGDGSAPQTVTGDPKTVTHVYATGNETFTISATANATVTNTSSLTNLPVTFVNSYRGGNLAVHVNAPVVINFTSGTATHLQGGAPDEYINYTQNGFNVTPVVAIDGEGAHFHLANGALYTHVHDDELGGPGVAMLEDQNGGSFFMVDSIVVPQLDNTAGGGSLTFSDSNGDSLTVTAAGTYYLNWGPISSFTITPHNLLDSLDQRGYVDSINVATVS